MLRLGVRKERMISAGPQVKSQLLITFSYTCDDQLSPELSLNCIEHVDLSPGYLKSIEMSMRWIIHIAIRFPKWPPEGQAVSDWDATGSCTLGDP